MIGAAACRRMSLAVLAVVLTLSIGSCSKRIYEGQRPIPEPTAQDRVLRHEVSAGESLAVIADYYYGDPGQRARIARDNGLADPEHLVPGSVLLLQFSAVEWQFAQKRAAAMLPYNRGVGLLQEERLAEAEQQFRSALEVAPDFVNARYNLALVMIKRGQNEQAERLLLKLTRDRPGDPDFLFAYGHVLFLETRFEEAIAAFQRLLAADPRHRRGAFGLARSLQEAGRRQEAIAAWEAYLLLDDSSARAEDARRNLAQLRSE